MPRSDPLLPLPHAGQEDRGCEALLEENRDSQLAMPHDQAWAAAVEEKNLDGGIEEESNTGQRQREDEQSARRAGRRRGGGLRWEAQEEP